MDIWSKEKRSKVMANIRSSNTRPEKMLRSYLHRAGLRFRINRKDLPGKPDIVFPKQKVAIFVHGCFWHFHQKCKEGKIPKTNTQFWKAKLQKNVIRDTQNTQALKKLNWKSFTLWECEIENQPVKSAGRVITFLKNSVNVHKKPNLHKKGSL